MTLFAFLPSASTWRSELQPRNRAAGPDFSTTWPAALANDETKNC
jgi:hypothetical protein